MNWIVAAAIVSLSGAAALIALSLNGPVNLATLTPAWTAIFLALLVAVSFWWAGYLWLLRQLSPKRLVDFDRVSWPLALLSLSLVPDLAVFLSGRLPYSILFDPDTYTLYRYLAGSIVGATLLLQELELLMAVRGASLAGLMNDAVRLGVSTARWTRATPRSAITVFRSHLPLLVILVIGGKLRLDALDVYHPGDMDVMLSLTYNLLGWPLVTYYHNYMPQTWVYNHLPFFPIMLAPFYWLFENLLHLPTPWAAKLLIGAADGVIAVVLYRQAGRGWHRAWGLALAGLWMLSPMAVRGDDHPIPVAIAFALLAMSTLERPWLSGLMLALGIATRNEVAFLALPVLIHFVARRPLVQSVAFLATFGTTLALVALPFVLFDPAAMDYALRRQLQRDAATELSMLSSSLLPYLGQGMLPFLRNNATLMALAFNGLIALLALRDGRVSRVVLLVALGYLLTMPILLDRYYLFAFAAGLFYAARYANPIIAGMVFLAVWPDFPYAAPGLIALFVAVVAIALLLPDKAPRYEIVNSRSY